MAGNDKGRVFDIPSNESVLGRGAQCDFVLADLAVSRRHVTVNFDGSTCMLTDQGSGNGTKVNGFKISTHALADGDEIELGKTLLRFRWAAAIQPVPAPHPGPRPQQQSHSPAMSQPPVQAAPQPAAGGVHPPEYMPPPPDAPIPHVGTSSYTDQVDPMNQGAYPAMDPNPPTGKVMPAVSVRGKFFGSLGRLTDTTPKKVLVLGGLGVVFLLMSLAMVGKLKGKKRAKKPVAPSGPAAPTQEQLFEQGKQLFKARKWEEAERVFLQLSQADPDNPFVKNRLAKIKKNVIARKYLEDAQKAFRTGDAKKAEVFISAITKETEYYYAEGQKLVTRIRKQNKAEALLADAIALKQSKKKQKQKEALEKVKEALKQIPGYPPAVKLWKEWEAGPIPPDLAGAKPKPAAVAAVTPARPAELPRAAVPSSSGGPDVDPRESRGSPRKSPGRTPSIAAPRISASGSHKQAMAFYRAKNWSAAYAELRRVAASQKGRKAKRTAALADKVRKMGSAFGRGESNQHSNSVSAMRAYQSALRLDQSISRGAHSGYIKSKLAKVARAAAGSAFSTGRYAEAYRAVKTAQRYGGTTGSLKRILSQLEGKAKAVFNQGYIKRDSNLNKARSSWRQVLRMVPPSSVWYKKAKWFLNNYGKAKAKTSDEDEL